jgi:hypothetical protein
MLIPNHPDPERLSALASGDTDATADTSLSAHVSTCVRCTTLVDELGALRTSLAELPDLRPHRPLRLLPEVVDEPSRVDRLGGWARRFFAPVLTAGAALAMVGLIGTTTPALEGLGAGSAATGTDQAGLEREGAPGAEVRLATPSSFNLDSAGQPDEPGAMVPLDSGTDDGVATGQSRDGDDAEQLSQETSVERSPWPMVLFAGLALMVAAGLLRWILAPRTA